METGSTATASATTQFSQCPKSLTPPRTRRTLADLRVESGSITRNFTLKAEYLYVDLGDVTANVSGGVEAFWVAHRTVMATRAVAVSIQILLLAPLPLISQSTLWHEL